MIYREEFGKTINGEKVFVYKIINDRGAYVSILNYGCIVQKLCVRDKKHNLIDVVLGYDTVEEYEKNNFYFGAVIGRNSNRISDSNFIMNDNKYDLEANDGANNLHGGPKGFNTKVWDAQIKDDKLILGRISSDGEEGFPGNLNVKVTYRFTDNNELIIDYYAQSDKNTLCNLTNHSYFNLNGIGNILDHTLELKSDKFTENNRCCIPTGKINSVIDTPMDFRIAKKIGLDINSDYSQIKYFGGYDNNFILNDNFYNVATLYSDITKISMKLYTTEPCVQLYTGNSIKEHKGKGDCVYNKYSGLCLETQNYPNGINIDSFPSSILYKNRYYKSQTIYSFEIMK